MSQQVILAPSASLRGRNLTHVYVMAKNHPDPETFAMFKKKEPLDNMAKSLLKHRIQVWSKANAISTHLFFSFGYFPNAVAVKPRRLNGLGLGFRKIFRIKKIDG